MSIVLGVLWSTVRSSTWLIHIHTSGRPTLYVLCMLRSVQISLWCLTGKVPGAVAILWSVITESLYQNTEVINTIIETFWHGKVLGKRVQTGSDVRCYSICINLEKQTTGEWVWLKVSCLATFFTSHVTQKDCLYLWLQKSSSVSDTAAEDLCGMHVHFYKVHTCTSICHVLYLYPKH